VSSETGTRDAAGHMDRSQVGTQSQDTTVPGRANPNHYSGNEGFANYGYTLINGVWVDPDGEGELYDALTNHEGVSPQQPLPALTKGPRVMDRDEEDEFYKAYAEDMLDEEDLEGDPRQLRISPATFAQWAVGAGAGDRYITTEVPAEVSAFTRPIYNEGSFLHCLIMELCLIR
jgi:hypothetical protein